MAMQERKLNEVEWKKPGTIVRGHLLSVRAVKYSDNIGLVYTVRETNGLVSTFRGATRLNALLHRTDEGKLVEIEYLGSDGAPVKDGMSPAKIFRVQVDEDSATNLKNFDVNEAPITDADLPPF